MIAKYYENSTPGKMINDFLELFGALIFIFLATTTLINFYTIIKNFNSLSKFNTVTIINLIYLYLLKTIFQLYKNTLPRIIGRYYNKKYYNQEELELVKRREDRAKIPNLKKEDLEKKPLKKDFEGRVE